MKLVVFDCDGTLVDSEHEIGANMREAFASRGQPWPGQAATRAIIGLSLYEAMRVLAPKADHNTHVDLVEAYRKMAHRNGQKNSKKQVFYQGAIDAVEKLAAKDAVFVAIATGKSYPGVLRILGNANWPENMFVSIQTADTAPSKPNPEMVLNAMEAAGGLAGDDSVVVGDASYDMEMARAAGAFALGVDWGYHSQQQLLDAGAHKVISGFDQLEKALSAFWGNDYG